MAHAQGNPADYPGKKPKKSLPTKSVQLLMMRNLNGEIMLNQRPTTGIWGGLWSFPELAIDSDPADYCRDFYGIPCHIEVWDSYRHTFSHYHLEITPILMSIQHEPIDRTEEPRLWFTPNKPQSVGLAAPVKRLLEQVEKLSPLNN